mgnify:CR=1 FL=1
MRLQPGTRAILENAPSLCFTRVDEKFLPHALLLDSKQASADRIYKFLPKLYASRSPVLFIGENGAGKETLARLLHYCGCDRREDFIAINCATFRSSSFKEILIHKQGRPLPENRTEASERRLSATIYLKNVDKLSPELQCELLFLLQDKCLTAPSSSREIQANIRVLASAQYDFDEAVEFNAILKALFFRLSTYTFFLPPLRERKEDIPPFANYFRREFAVEYHTIPPIFSQESLNILKKHDWPGNLQELRDIVFHSLYEAKDGIPQQETLNSLIAESRLPRAKKRIRTVQVKPHQNKWKPVRAVNSGVEKTAVKN